MQHAKNSFYAALRDRLHVVNPQRIVVVNGTERPAIVVIENEMQRGTPSDNVFEVRWGGTEQVGSGTRLWRAECQISYQTAGTQPGGNDRGIALAAMDSELIGITSQRDTPKRNLTLATPTDLGTAVIWDAPRFEPAIDEGERMTRRVNLNVFFFPEAIG